MFTNGFQVPSTVFSIKSEIMVEKRNEWINSACKPLTLSKSAFSSPNRNDNNTAKNSYCFFLHGSPFRCSNMAPPSRGKAIPHGSDGSGHRAGIVTQASLAHWGTPLPWLCWACVCEIKSMCSRLRGHLEEPMRAGGCQQPSCQHV